MKTLKELEAAYNMAISKKREAALDESISDAVYELLWLDAHRARKALDEALKNEIKK
jgi:hypothetical protein